MTEPQKAEKQPKEADSEDETVEEPPKFTRKELATLAQRIEILDWHHENGKNQTKTAKFFSKEYPNLVLKQPLLSKWLKAEATWRERWAMAHREDERNAKRVKQTQHPAVTEMMDLWVEKATHDRVLLSGDVLRAKWVQFAELAGIPEDERLSLSNGWLDKFKASVGLKGIKQHGDAASANPESVEKERARLRKLLRTLGYAPRDTWNMDETGLFWACVLSLFDVYRFAEWML